MKDSEKLTLRTFANAVIRFAMTRGNESKCWNWERKDELTAGTRMRGSDVQIEGEEK